MTGNRKFFVALFSIMVGVGVIFHPVIKDIATPFYTCLGVIASGFFAINGVEHWTSKKGE
jgi:hypothetical protein